MTAAELAYKTSAQAIDGDELVIQELPQVYYIAARIRERLPQHVEMEDLVSAGVVGLIEATRSFDGSKNVQFKTFAKFRIRGAILDSLRETDWGSRYMRRKGREIAEATAKLESKLGRHPTEAEVAQEMQLEPRSSAPLDRAAGLAAARRTEGSGCERSVGFARCDRVGAESR